MRANNQYLYFLPWQLDHIKEAACNLIRSNISGHINTAQPKPCGKRSVKGEAIQPMKKFLSVYSLWIDVMEQEDLKMLAMLLYDNYRKRFDLAY